MRVVMWLFNSAHVAGVHTPAFSQCVGGMLLEQWCHEQVLNCPTTTECGRRDACAGWRLTKQARS